MKRWQAAKSRQLARCLAGRVASTSQPHACCYLALMLAGGPGAAQAALALRPAGRHVCQARCARCARQGRRGSWGAGLSAGGPQRAWRGAALDDSRGTPDQHGKKGWLGGWVVRRWGCPPPPRRGWAAEPQPVSFALCTVALWMHSSRWSPPICAPCEASSLHSVRRPPPHRAPPRCAWPPRPRPPTRAARASSKAPTPRTCWCPLDRSKTSSIRHTSTSRCPLPRLEFPGRSSPSKAPAPEVSTPAAPHLLACALPVRASESLPCTPRTF